MPAQPHRIVTIIPNESLAEQEDQKRESSSSWVTSEEVPFDSQISHDSFQAELTPKKGANKP